MNLNTEPHIHAKKETTRRVAEHFVKQICETDVVCVKDDATLYDAARLMRDNHVGDVVVIEEKDGSSLPIGVITDRDIVIEATAQLLSPDSLKVSDLIERNIVTAKETDGIMDLIKAFKENGVSRLPIVDDSGSLVGILSSKRLFQFLAQGLCDMSGITERQQEREQLKH